MDVLHFVRMDVVDDVDGEEIKSIFTEHFASGQTVRSDGFPAYNVVKDIRLVHGKQIVYPKQSAPRHNVLK